MASKWVPVVSKSHLDPVTNTAQVVSPPSLGKLEQDVPGTGPEVAVPWESIERVGIFCPHFRSAGFKPCQGLGAGAELCSQRAVVWVGNARCPTSGFLLCLIFSVCECVGGSQPVCARRGSACVARDGVLPL